MEILRKIEDFFAVKSIDLVEFVCFLSSTVGPIDTLESTSRLGHHPLMGGMITWETGKQAQLLSFNQMKYSRTPSLAICDTADFPG